MHAMDVWWWWPVASGRVWSVVWDRLCPESGVSSGVVQSGSVVWSVFSGSVQRFWYPFMWTLLLTMTWTSA